MDTNIIGGFLFSAILLIVIIGIAINEVKDRKKNNRPEQD